MTAITVQLLPIASIAAPSYVRTQNGHDKESLSQLAASINQHGLLQPIVVRPTSNRELDENGKNLEQQAFDWVMVDGRRRLAACKLAGMTEIPALVTDTDEAKAYELEITANIQREDMTLADTARAVRTLMTIYGNAKKVGEILNKSAPWVSKHLAVTSSKCPAVILDMLDRNIVTDLETLVLLKQIAEFSNSNHAAASTMARMLRIAHEGNMNRQIARDTLAKLKTPAPAHVTTVTGAKRALPRQTVSEQPEMHDTDPLTHFNIALPITCLEALDEVAARDGRTPAEWIAIVVAMAEDGGIQALPRP